MKLLIVEDDDGMSVVLHRILARTQNSHIKRVCAWKEMEEALRSESYDVILLDLGLPDSPTTETLSKIRSLKMNYPSTGVCVITGQPTQTIESSKAAGADDFLHKADMMGTPTSLIKIVSGLFNRFSSNGPMKKLDTQVNLLQQAAQAKVEELNKPND